VQVLIDAQTINVSLLNQNYLTKTENITQRNTQCRSGCLNAVIF